MFHDNEHNDGLAHGEHVAQNVDFVRSVQRPVSDVGVPVVAPGNHASTLSNTSENKPEMNNSNPAADMASTAPNLNKKDMKANMHHNDKPAHHDGEHHKDNHIHNHGQGKPHPHHDDEPQDESSVAAQNKDKIASLADTEESVSAGQVVYSASDSYNSTGNEAMAPFTDTFTVPEGRASAYAYLQVDDWGSVEISGIMGICYLPCSKRPVSPDRWADTGCGVPKIQLI